MRLGPMIYLPECSPSGWKALSDDRLGGTVVDDDAKARHRNRSAPFFNMGKPFSTEEMNSLEWIPGDFIHKLEAPV
jgi:hypothetical protein